MPTTQAKNGQTLVDIAMQQTGDSTGVAGLALVNNIGITEKLAIGEELQNAKVINPATVQQFETQLVQPASDDNHQTLGGIGYWRIGIDFKIS
jgi:hypothetical protein